MTRPLALVPLQTYPEPAEEASAAAAVRFAARLGADVHALAVLPEIPDVSNALSNLMLDLPAMVRKANAEGRAHGQRLAAAAEAAAREAGVAFTHGEVATELAAMPEAAADAARYHDLTVVALPRDTASARALAEGIVFGSGRPTVLLPAGWDGRPVEHVAIAWDGGRVAARAVADAALVLARALRVTVMTVTDEKPLPAGDIAGRLAANLRRGGRAVDVAMIPAEDCAISVTLQEHAADRGVDLLVMGGYGHSRLRDFVLGGATRGVLDDPRLPTLLSH